MEILCNCGKSHEIKRDENAPKNAISMRCNWCPSCDSNPQEDYREWYKYEPKDKLEIININQLKIF